MARALLPAFVLLCLAAPPAASQDSDGTPADSFPAVGRIADAETRIGLGEAIVEAPALGIRVVSDASGRVELGRLPAGWHRVRAERAGYEILDGEIQVPRRTGFLMLMSRAPLNDTLAAGRIVGRVTGEDGRTGLPEVEVTIPGARGATAVSDRSGRFELRDVSPGLVEIRLAALGHAPRTEKLVVHPARTVQIAATLSAQPIELEPVEVVVRSRRLEQNGFYRRAERGIGTQLSRQDIEVLGPVWTSDLVRRSTTGVDVRFDPITNTSYALSRRGAGSCVLPVYVDGVPAGSHLDKIPPEWLDAAEIYHGLDTPVQYRGLGASTRGRGVFSGGGAAGACGAVLLWTRR